MHSGGNNLGAIIVENKTLEKKKIVKVEHGFEIRFSNPSSDL